MINIEELANKIKEMKSGTITTIAELIDYDPKKNMIEPMEQGRFVRRLEEECKKYDIELERNRDEKGGLAFFAKFKIIDLKEYQEYIDKINKYNELVAKGQAPENDISELMSEFSTKFGSDSMNSDSTEDTEFTELVNKINKSLENGYVSSNLSPDEQIDEINKRIAELEKEEM